MLAHIEKIREKPKAHRSVVQLGSTVAIMAVIVFVWVTSQVANFGDITPVLASADDGAVLLGAPESEIDNRPVDVLTATVAEAGKEMAEIFNQAIDVFVEFRDRNF